MFVIPKRHTADYFELGTAESRACHRLITEARSLVCKADPAVMGFNVGINSRQVAGQTVMHCHLSDSTSDKRLPKSTVRGARSDSSIGSEQFGAGRSRNELLHVYQLGIDVCAISKSSVGQWKGYGVFIFVREGDGWKIRSEYDGNFD
jgi:hypothetical protein